MVWVGGPHVLGNRLVQPICQGHPVGRYRVMVRAVVAIRAGTPIRERPTVPVVALASRGAGQCGGPAAEVERHRGQH